MFDFCTSRAGANAKAMLKDFVGVVVVDDYAVCKALFKDKIKEVVFVMDKDSKAKLREVKTGISDFENIEILSGLKEGETIISGPYITVSKKLKEGELVMKKKIEEKKK